MDHLNLGEPVTAPSATAPLSTATFSSSIPPPQQPMQAAYTSTSGFETLRSRMSDLALSENCNTAFRTRLANIFGWPSVPQSVVEFPCYLLKSVLLQGYLYLTPHHLSFHAYLPRKDDTILKSGTLSRKSSRGLRWKREYVLLKDGVLSGFASSSDLYFPTHLVDVARAVHVSGDGKEIRVTMQGGKEHVFGADSELGAKEWVKAMQKVVFCAHNPGDAVKIVIPLPNILETESVPASTSSEETEGVVLDDETFLIEEYFFAFFGGWEEAVKMIGESVERSNGGQVNGEDGAGVGERKLRESVRDTTASLGSKAGTPTTLGGDDDSSSSSADDDDDDTEGDAAKTNALPTKKSHTIPLPKFPGMKLLGRTRTGHQGTHTTDPSEPVQHPALQRDVEEAITKGETSSRYGDDLGARREEFVGKHGGGGLGGLLRKGVGKIMGGGGASVSGAVPPMEGRQDGGVGGGGVSDVVEESHKFRSHFALPAAECYITRSIPLYGKLYASDRNLCFRSTLPGTKTRMIVPLRDVETVEPEKGFQVLYSGLVVLIRGHEELFLEFASEEGRDEARRVIEDAVDEALRDRTRSRLTVEEMDQANRDKEEHLFLAERHQKAHDARPPPENEGAGNDVPPIIFDDPGTSFVTFKPEGALRVTCLTIGSRGDVQPYVALCKELLKEGHKPRIASHAEYKDWVEGHGIEFMPVEGDPAELMRICVENGMFTYSFLKEASSKFRDWIDGLLKSAWDACQGSDVLIESPSAMAGFHIAEALGIPYFRAFTMPWTRTRTYPHAFVVPDHKMGGSYNYFTYVMFDNLFWKATAGQVNRWRKRTLNLGSTSWDKMDVQKVPFLYNFSPSVVPPPLDWPEWVKVTGYWFLDDPDSNKKKKWEPPEELTAFIEKARSDGKKLVYIGFGSITVSDPKALTKSVVESVVNADVRCILSKGWSERGGSEEKKDKDEVEVPLPDSMHQIESAPHDWLFPRVDVAVHHGGSGTTGASLRAGIPTVIKPFFGDQFFFANRVEDLGVGIGLKKLNVTQFTKALVEATNDEKMIARAKVLGEQIRSENGCQNAIQAIYRELEYAKSLIKTPQRHHAEGSKQRASKHSLNPFKAINKMLQGVTQTHGSADDDEPDFADATSGRTDVEHQKFSDV
ncbi:UDP-Glycosyltransferase/glycogen phosphorylase [Saitoella complicata NRRL Y-17804]|uniref:UDP-Glycosyltransferase/glycogen phosphorylase n=1 Tax=Saitoella complicata (strain BCRC 22490 / CBS 7301 / JCM 7358 / NBRC 10748 / NRRL Y-17804) TaxID=698492 RepID=UPI000867A300|nr:UDP-Glycosyltransferase/glycogen phosphorylase [Saitoella complicata NRRL Y-17804]ODQ56617.1 UDP-Glycosyltransferase/glycogen phosphorylase [Saitoella complicata NRRL Y-17804]